MKGDQREWLGVAASAVLILLLTPVVVSMMIEAWETDGFVWETAVSLTVDRGYDIGLVVAVPAGVALGWILLFVLDESKRVQRLIVPMFGVVFAVAVWSRGLWFGDTVDWSINLPFFAGSILVGLATGGGVEYLNRQEREFKRAGWLLYLFVTGAIFISIVQLALESEIGGVSGLGQIGASAGLLLVLAVFVEYENERSISLIATDERSRTTVVGGLCKTIREEGRKHSFDGEGAEKMVRALTGLDQEDEEMLPNLSGEIEFRYLDTDSLVSRWISVEAEGVDTDYLRRQMDPGGKLEEKTSYDNSLSFLMLPFRVLAPPILRNLGQGDTRAGSLSERLDTSDVLLVAVPFSDLAQEDGNSSVNEVRNLLRRYSESSKPKTVLVVTEAEAALERYKKERGETPLLNEGKVEDYIRMNVMDDYHGEDILTVSAEKNMSLGDGDLAWREMQILLEEMSG